MEDPYREAEGPASTPPDQICDCAYLSEIYLAFKPGSHPLHCVQCGRQVTPEDLALPADLAEEVAAWNSLFGAVYHLWLDSGEYEEWAHLQLLNIASYANRRGLELVRRLDGLLPAYYLCFWEETQPADCPICGHLMASKGESDFVVCKPCRMLA